ncbi:MAG TPA: DUF4124 domain-containing protein [Steroidobacteraceae bacterium]|nr:DUF4124 domain-containing protein [Steroidobacteraceae bacterium]
MRRLSFTLILLASTVVSAATVYKWVDENGVTHYSDQPHTGAMKLHVEGAQTYTAQSPPPDSTSSQTRGQQQPAQPSAVCAIDSPNDDEMLMNEHSVSGHARFDPTPGAADQIILFLDGKTLSGAAVDSSGGFTIPQIDRGTHTLSLQVVSRGGQVLCQSPSITFHVHQPSSQAPNPANRPRF